MRTLENELTEAVDLRIPDGSRLNPAALGWSRRLLHRANLEGHFGRNKRWDYWVILSGDLMVSVVFADVDHLGLAEVWWAVQSTGQTGGSLVVTGSGDIVLPDRPGAAPLRIDRAGDTENGIIVDGRLSKLGNELDWSYGWGDPMAPWRIVGPGGQLDVTLTPTYDKHSVSPGCDKGSETHQVFGTWSGRLRTDDGLELVVDRLQGCAEEARQEW